MRWVSSGERRNALETTRADPVRSSPVPSHVPNSRLPGITGRDRGIVHLASHLGIIPVRPLSSPHDPLP